MLVEAIILPPFTDKEKEVVSDMTFSTLRALAIHLMATATSIDEICKNTYTILSLSNSKLNREGAKLNLVTLIETDIEVRWEG